MIKHPAVVEKYKKVVNQYNRYFGETEQVRRYILMDYEWSIQTGELTPTLKIRRNFVTQKFADTMEKLFS